MAMKRADKKFVCGIIEEEGFDYTFACYSNFSEVRDEKFHQLRKEYLAAAKRFAEYFGCEDYNGMEID